jgi:PKD repeat protein
MLFKKKGWGKFLAIALIFTFLFQCVGMIVPEPANAASTELTITKYAGDGKTIIDQLTVDYHWLMDSDNIPVLGDGTTRYYHQGPVFIDEPADDPVELERLRWNEEEDRNWDTKDMGAVKGNNLKDLCNLVGGMVESDEVQIKATDGFNKKFAYKNVYNYDPDREGPMVVCWYKDGLYPDTGYTDGMRLVWFAAASSKVGPTDVAGLPSGDYHVFGNWEWREAADPEYWYYYSGIYPTTTGLSVQNVASINIYSNETVLTPPDLTADTEDNQIGQAVDITFTDDEDWRTAISRIRVNGREIDGENYSLSPGKISIVADVFDQAGEYNIAVIAEGYSMVTVTQSMVAAPSAPVAAFSADKTSGPAPLTVQFTDESTGNPTSWEWDFDNDGEVDSTQQNPSHEYTQVGTYTVKLTVTNSAGNDDEIKTNYITVSEPGVPVTGVSITEGDQTLEIGQTVQLTAVVEPENATDKNVFWSSDNDAVAMVDGAGLVTAIAEGAAIITVTTEDGNKTDSITVTVVEGSGGPTVDVLYEGTVILTPGETFTVTVGTNEYTINDNTPLGALQAAAEAGKFSYLLSDKRWSYDGVLLLDDVGQYVRKSPGYWYDYVNDVYKDGYQNTPDGLNVIEMLDGDKVEFYYAAGISDPNDLNAVKAAATAAVKTVVALSTIDVIYDGTLNLDPEEEFIVSAYNSGTEYTVNQNTPLGALHKAAIASGFTYDVTDKNYGNSGALLLDRIADYNYVKNGSAWYAYVNGALKDGYNNPDGALNLIQLADGDKVEFYYADVEDETDFNAVKAAATAAVKITVANGVVPTDWTLQLSGARDETIPKAYFEQGLACPSSGHQVSWTDDKGTPDPSDDDVWGGVPLWLLVAMVDDNPDMGSFHYNFNQELANQDYEIKIIAGDGWSTTLSSADIARSDAYIVANTLNGEPLPLKTESGKDCWPLQLKGSAIAGGQQVGNIVRIELSGLPEPPAGWTLELIGDIGDTITQEEFEEGLACAGSDHYQEWTDKEGNVWSGIPLWVLLGAVDDIEQIGNHWTFDPNTHRSQAVHTRYQ